MAGVDTPLTGSFLESLAVDSLAALRFLREGEVGSEAFPAAAAPALPVLLDLRPRSRGDREVSGVGESDWMKGVNGRLESSIITRQL